MLFRSINNVRYGGDPFDNCNLLSENPGYFPMFSILEGYFAKLTSLFGVGTIKSMIIFSYVLSVLGIIVSFSLFRLVFGDDYLAATGVLLFMTARPIFKYTEFGAYVVQPLFLITLYMFYKRQSLKNAAFLGLMIGLSSITHAVLFVSSYFLAGITILYILLDKKLELPKKNIIIKNIRSSYPALFVMALLAAVISSLYWYNPLIVHHARTSLHYLEWNGPGDMSNIGLQFKMLFDIIKGNLFNFRTIISAISSVLMLTGILFIFTIKNPDEKTRFVKLVFLGVVMLTFSYFATMPLLGIHFVPNYMIKVAGKAILAMVMLFSLRSMFLLLEKKKVLTEKNNLRAISSLILMVLLLVSAAAGVGTYVNDNKWFKVSQSPLSRISTGMQGFVLENTGVDDVFLTTKETGFMLNALTGRKLVSSRRAQNDAYEDLDSREMDMAVILYGDNVDVKKGLIKKYNIKYLYWDYYWIQSEYYFDDKGRITSWFDPLIAFKDERYISLLNKNNVSYFVQNTYVDPTLKSRYHPTFELIFISPQNYHNATHPWNPNLDPYLEEVWSFEQNGQKLARIFKVNI